MNKALLLIILYVILNFVAIAVSSGKSKRDSAEQFMVAHGTNGWKTLFLSMFGLALAGGGTTAVVAACYEVGISGSWANWGTAASYLVFTYISMRLFRVLAYKYGVNTTSGAIEVLFERKNSILNTIIFIIFALICFALQPKAVAAVVCPITGWDTDVVVIVTGIAFSLVSVLGGAKSVVWVSIVNAIVMFFALATICVTSVNQVGGLGQLFVQLPPSYVHIFSPDVPTVLGNLLSMILGSCFLSTSVNLAFTAKTKRDADIGFGLAGLFIAIVGFLNGFIGMSAYAIDPNMEVNGALMGVAGKFGQIMAGFVGCGIMAAILSSAPSNVLSISNHFTEDIYHVFINPKATDKQRIRVSKIVGVLVGVIGVALSYASSSLIVFLYAAIQIVVPTSTVLMISLFWKRVNSNAAFWSVLSGTVVAFVWFAAGNPFGVNTFWPSFGVTTILLVILTLAAKEPVSEGHKRYMAAKAEYESAGANS